MSHFFTVHYNLNTNQLALVRAISKFQFVLHEAVMNHSWSELPVHDVYEKLSKLTFLGLNNISTITATSANQWRHCSSLGLWVLLCDMANKTQFCWTDVDIKQRCGFHRSTNHRFTASRPWMVTALWLITKTPTEDIKSGFYFRNFTVQICTSKCVCFYVHSWVEFEWTSLELYMWPLSSTL